MCEIPTSLAGEKKIPGGLVPPMGQGVAGRKMIKGRIDLDGGKMSGIVGKEFLTRHACWIKRADPMRIMPTGGPDIEIA